jgi:CHAT domain-containing protein
VNQSTQNRRWHWKIRFIAISVLTTILCVVASPGLALLPIVEQIRVETPAPPSTDALMQQGQQLYDAERYPEAIAQLQQAIQAYQNQGNVLGQAMALRNLALVHQALGEWPQANDAIASSLQLLQPASPGNTEQLKVLARVLDLQGTLQLRQGQAEEALVTWEQAIATYRQAGDESGALHSQINQAQAFQTLGFYRRAIATLTPLTESLRQQPNSLTKAVALRSLGDALQSIGALEASQNVLEEGVMVAEQLQDSSAISAAQFSLGNTLRAQGKVPEALEFYRQAADTSPNPVTQVQATLNELSLLIAAEQRAEAQSLLPHVETRLNALPLSQARIYAQVNFAQSLLQLQRQHATQPGASQESMSSLASVAQRLAQARQQAKELADVRAESFALGSLAGVYEKTGQWETAETLTEQALVLAQTVSAADIAYRWQWQLGRIFKAEADLAAAKPGKYQDAIAAYSAAIDTLQVLRNDLVAISPEVQLSFQESVEPIHRELVSLLLAPEEAETSQENLEKARTVIESLQLAELDNFFREACLDAQPVEIDQVDRAAAVIYPIMLQDRLEVVLSLPQQKLRHYASPIPRSQVETTVEQLRRQLVIRSSRQFLTFSQRLYDWLIRPLEADLTNSGAKTLIFVLDGPMRNIPMAVLNDGQQYLLEKYSLGLTPGLQLLDPRPLVRGKLSVLTAGLTEPRQGFSALPNVLPEVEQIQQEVPSRVLLNQAFTSTAFQEAIAKNPSPVVHLATHGKFSSQLDQTFILTWDSRIDINQLNTLLQRADLSQANPIELLVLSACQTAAGDQLAALGLAGVAVRAGARSTLATLWQVSDEATSILMREFYQEIVNDTITKAEALRLAQLKVLQTPQFRQHPYYWAAYVMVGSWL